MPNNDRAILTELRVNKLPSLPHVLVEMLRACQDANVSFQNIADVISRDAAICARVIALANSSFYGNNRHVNSIERALLVLGTDTLKTIVITAAVQQFFSGFNAAHGPYLKRFWRRSLFCALLSRSLATLTSYPNPEEAYLTGLLHNIGELVLETNHSKEFETLFSSVEDEARRLTLEIQEFQVDHCEVGAWLAKKWNLGEFASEAIRFHHTAPEYMVDAHHLVKIINLASTLSREQALEQTSSFEVSEALFDLSASLTKEIVSKIEDEVLEIAQSLEIDIDQYLESDQDQIKQVALAEHVRDIGLLQTASEHLTGSTTHEELFRAIEQSVNLLFGYNTSMVLQLDKDSNKLRIHGLLADENVPLAIPMSAERSLIARSAINNEVLVSFLDSNSESDGSTIASNVVDQHFIRLSQSEGIICVPMWSQSEVAGVLVMGINQPYVPRPNTTRLLKYFASEAAAACLALDQSKPSGMNASEAIETIKLKAREIVHEANNPLGIVSNYLETLASKLGDDHEVQSELDVLREEIDRTGKILLRLKDLQMPSQEQDNGVDINHELQSLVSLYESSLFLTHRIDCRLELDKALERQPGNRNTIRQIITNLVKNAVEAMPDGGSLLVSSSACVNVNGADYIEIRIRDDGPGIPLEILKDLFKPVKSTKGEGHSGLGLSITKNLISDAGGTISCRSNSHGTEFQVLLPIRSD